MVDQDYLHLNSATREILVSDDHDVIEEHIFSEHWIGYKRAEEALSRLFKLYNFPKRKRMPNLLIIGPTNNGKTMIIEKFKRKFAPPVGNYVGGRYTSYKSYPVLTIQMPSSPDIRRFYGMILHQFGYAMPGNARHGKLEDEILTLLKDMEVKMLIIDEIHNILAGRSDQQREFLNVLRFLGNELSIPLVCAGTKDAYLAIRSDNQLENRFEPFLLPVWKEGDEYNSLLASFVRLMPLKHVSNLTDPVIAEKILILSEGILGEIATLITRAAYCAFVTKENEINESILNITDYESPTERKKIFERGLL